MPDNQVALERKFKETEEILWQYIKKQEQVKHKPVLYLAYESVVQAYTRLLIAINLRMRGIA